jgi:hypothetical protein
MHDTLVRRLVFSVPNPPATMPQISLEKANYQSIFDSALQEYEKKTRKDPSLHPLFCRLESCDSPDGIITILRQQIPGFDQSADGSSDDRLTRWLDPTVKVINAFSATIGNAVSLVSFAANEVTHLESAH